MFNDKTRYHSNCLRNSLVLGCPKGFKSCPFLVNIFDFGELLVATERLAEFKYTTEPIGTEAAKVCFLPEFTKICLKNVYTTNCPPSDIL